MGRHLQIFTGVDGHIQIGSHDFPFSAYTWIGAVTTLPMWTAASSPFPDQLPCQQQPMSLAVRGLFADDMNPADFLSNGIEVADVIVFVSESITATCDFALITGFTTGVTADGASFFQLILTSSWNYGDFTGR
jgi:hypothetical protein